MQLNLGHNTYPDFMTTRWLIQGNETLGIKQDKGLVQRVLRSQDYSIPDNLREFPPTNITFSLMPVIGTKVLCMQRGNAETLATARGMHSFGVNHTFRPVNKNSFEDLLHDAVQVQLGLQPDEYEYEVFPPHFLTFTARCDLPVAIYPKVGKAELERRAATEKGELYWASVMSSNRIRKEIDMIRAEKHNQPRLSTFYFVKGKKFLPDYHYKALFMAHHLDRKA